MITTTLTHETEKDAISCIRHHALAQLIKDMDEKLRQCTKYRKSFIGTEASNEEIEVVKKIRTELLDMIQDNDLWFVFRYEDEDD